MKGIINFYKPRGMTSHSAVNFFRKLLGVKRIGHTGTLDPNAEGVLPICVGKATRVSEYLLTEDKEYVGKLILGKSTDTQDAEGVTLDTSNKEVSEEEIYKSFNKFKGEIYQIPPMYSALKHKGKKLYELAREGKTVERTPRERHIYELDIRDIDENKEISFYTKCSRGTYIRTLCNDIGEDLGTFGYMDSLLRVGVGPFKIEESYKKEDLENLSKEQIEELMLPIDFALKKLPMIVLPKTYYKRLINGVKIDMDNKYCIIDEEIKVYCDNEFIGVGEVIMRDEIKLLKMNKVFV